MLDRRQAVMTGPEREAASLPADLEAGAPYGKARRLLWLDGLRGAALVGMITYHAAWDLHAYGLVATDPSVAPGWLLFGRFVAGLFLGLSGFGLALARRRGAGGRAIAVRLIRLAAAAALVSTVTWLVVPAAPIWFGILHCVLVTNIIALALDRLPGRPVLAVAAAASLAPFAFRGAVGVGWAWTGLAAVEPETLDFRPVLPWLAVVLVGLVVGRTRLAAWQDPPVGWRFGPLAWAGRHSLAIYLIHQPLMLAALMLVFGAMPDLQADRMVLRDPAQATAFLRQCRSRCDAGGGDAAFCTATCHCVLTAMLDPSSPATTPDAALKRCAPQAQADDP